MLTSTSTNIIPISSDRDKEWRVVGLAKDGFTL